MKQYGLRYLYKHLGQAIKDLPFEITNHNRVIAVVTKPYNLPPREEELIGGVTLDVEKIAKSDE